MFSFVSIGNPFIIHVPLFRSSVCLKARALPRNRKTETREKSQLFPADPSPVHTPRAVVCHVWVP